MIKRAAIMGALGLSACATTGAQPAVLTNPSPAVTQEIQRALTQALGRKTRIAANSLTSAPRLTLDPPFNDRSYARPDHFTLQKTGQSCVLLHEKTGQIYALKAAQCAALTPAGKPAN